MAAERMEELAGGATLRDAGITAGIATDKLLALSGDPQVNQQHLHVHLEPVDIIGQFNEMLSRLQSNFLEAKDTPAKALPSGQDPEATQSTTEVAEAVAQVPEACAREEKSA